MIFEESHHLNFERIYYCYLFQQAGSPSYGRSSGRRITFKQHITGFVTFKIQGVEEKGSPYFEKAKVLRFICIYARWRTTTLQ